MYISGMSRADSNQTQAQSRNWPALMLPLLAALGLAVIGKIDLLENGYYDHLQERQYNIPAADIMLLTVNPRLDNQANIWTAEGFLPLARQLQAAGARAIVPVQPLRFPDAPSLQQIEALEALQAKAGQTQDMDINPLTSDLPMLKARYAAREKVFDSYRSIEGLVLATELTDSFTSTTRADNACEQFAANHSDISTESIRRSRNIVLPEPELCNSIVGTGFASFDTSDSDVLRRSNLLVNANGNLHASLALATLAALKNSSLTVVSDHSIQLGSTALNTNSDFTILNQFYAQNESGSFVPAGYNEVISNTKVMNQVRDKIVLIGEAEYTGMPGYRTPINPNMTPLEMTATSLSNLLQKNYIVRPDWLPLTETLVLVGLVAACLVLLPRMGWIAALIVGISIGSMLIVLEAWLISEQLIWVQLATSAAYVTVAVFLITGIRGVNKRRRTKKDIGLKTLMAQSSNDSLDVQLSVLRQKKPDAINKRKIYDIALQYEQSQEFAKAEMALKHLEKADPDYMDVAEKLREISGNTGSQRTVPDEAAETANDQGQTLGRYKIIKTLGSGAMSTVYLGMDSKIQRKVAIKTIALADEFDEDELIKARAQFLREAESAGRLNHPDIIAIYDIGEDHRVAYLAMEYFSGTPLIDFADRRKLLPPVRVLQLLARAAEALDYAHSQKVVHRDIKPANILYDAATDRLKITDFGIARLTDTSRTKTGVILGTPSYMSPEQLSASGVTGQSDLYSLGVTLYHMLTGAPPFRADSIPQLMDKIIHDQPTKVTKHRPELPECLNNLINKALAKNPEDRFPNGKAMALALLACSKQVQL